MTNHYDLPRPTHNDPVDIPGDLQALAEAADTEFDRVSTNVPTIVPGRLLDQSVLTSYTTDGMAPTTLSRVSAPVVPGRLYRVGAWNIPVYANNYGRARLEIRYGTTPPTLSSTMIGGGQTELPNPSDYAWSVDAMALYGPTFNHTAHFSLILVPQVSSEFVRVAASMSWPLVFFVEDVGADPGETT